jgi:HlyD family secretion protein
MTPDTQPETAPRRPASPLTHLIGRERRRRQRRRTLLSVFLLGFAGVLTAGWRLAQTRPVPLATRFRTEAVTRGDLVREVRSTGQVEAVTTVDIGAEISGRIVSVEADYNDIVVQGQVLARFDRAALEAQLAQAEAARDSARAALAQAQTDLGQSQRDLARSDELWQQGVLTPSEHDEAVTEARRARQKVDAAEADLSGKEAAYEVAQTNLGHTVVCSPISGMVITRNIDPGQTVASSFETPILFTVAADLRQMRVIAPIDEADVGEVSEGQRAEFTVTAYPGRVFEGIVTQVRNAPETVEDVITYGSVILVDNEDLALKPGMTASVRIRTDSAQDVLRVPTEALEFVPPGQDAPGSPALWVIDGETVRSIPVERGLNDGEYTVVSGEGISVGLELAVDLTSEGRKAYGISN